MANIRIENTRVALSTAAAGNTQDITVSGLGVPEAAIFILSGGTTDDTIAADVVLSIGFTDGTNQACTAIAVEDNLGTTNDARAYDNDLVIAAPNVSGASNALEFGFNSWITDGVRLDIDVQSSAAYLLTVIFINGTDVNSVHVGTHDDLNTADITTIGFEPDLVFLTTVNSGPPPLTTTDARLSFGIGLNDGFDTQKCVMYSAVDNVTESNVNNMVRDGSIAAISYYDALQWYATIGTYDASGFSVTPSAATGTVVSYLCLKFNNAPDISLFDMTWPTTGSYAETTPGFTPTWGMLVGAVGPTAVDTLATDTVLSAQMISVFDATNIYTTSFTDADKRGTARSNTTICKSLSSDQLRFLGYDGTEDCVASSYAFDAQGWDFTISTNPAATVYGFGLAIDAPGAGSSNITINSVTYGPPTSWDYAVYDGGLIPTDSVLYYTDGSDDTSVSAAFLTDSTATWTINEWVGFKVRNTTDGSEGVITANTATTITATLSGGTDNDWDSGDAYEIVMNVDTNDQIVYETTTDIGGSVSAMSTKGVPTITGASGSHSFDVKYRDVTDSKVSSTVTVTVTV